MLVIQLYDKSAMGAVEKAILKADLGLTPSNDGNVIRLVLPQLTEERRKELVRLVRKMAEEKRVAVRNVRRDVNDDIRKAQKNGELPEDDARRAQEASAGTHRPLHRPSGRALEGEGTGNHGGLAPCTGRRPGAGWTWPV